MTLERSWGRMAVVGRTPEQAGEGARCVEALAVLFQPFVADMLAPHVDEMLKKPLTRKDVLRDIEDVFQRQATSVGMLLLKIPMLIKLGALSIWVGEKGKRLCYSERQRRQIHEAAARHTSYEIVRVWLQVLHEEARRRDNVLWLRRLDEAMLPREADPEAFKESVPVEVSDREIIDLLRAVRESLANSRKIPEYAESFLLVEGHEVRP